MHRMIIATTLEKNAHFISFDIAFEQYEEIND
jgi:PIN domain nuclease of toxin-antitoxin system